MAGRVDKKGGRVQNEKANRQEKNSQIQAAAMQLA